jgi:hypothetical protein
VNEISRSVWLEPRRAWLWCLIAGFLSASCASGSSGSSVSRDRSRISQEELVEFPSGTAYEAIERLRPRWIRSRGVSSTRPGATPDYAAVFIDNAPVGGLEALYRVSIRDIDYIEYMSASDATTRYGTGYPGGIIKIFTKSGTDR